MLNNSNNNMTARLPELEPVLLAEFTRALLPYLGPYSITTVKRASRLTSNPDEVIRTIANHIDEPGRRELFSKSAKRILKEYQQSSAIGAIAPLNEGASAAAAPSIINKTTDQTTSQDGQVAAPVKVRGAAPITVELMKRGEAALAPIIGPLAGVLVQRYARATDNSRDFFERLATHLRTTDERNSFFESVRTMNGLLQSAP